MSRSLTSSFWMIAVLLGAFASSGVFAADQVPLLPQSSKEAAKPAAKPAAPAKRAATPTKRASEPSMERLQDEQVQRNVNLINFAHERLKYLRAGEEGCADCLASSVGNGASALDRTDSAKTCKDKWSDFYSKDKIDIRFSFGYTDRDDNSLVDDTIARQSMVDQITKPCESNNLVQACGFTRSPDDADLFERRVRGPNGKRHTLQVRLTSSSFSPSGKVNESLPMEQKEKTEQAASNFYSGLKEADMVVYIGHARDGGGPDFAPAIRKNGKTDFAKYRAETPGMNRLTQELESGANAKIIAFLACDSERWSDRLKRLAPKSGIVLSGTPNIPLEAALVQSYLLLDSVIWQRCEGAFNKALNELDSYDDRSLVPLKLQRFFK